MAYQHVGSNSVMSTDPAYRAKIVLRRLSVKSVKGQVLLPFEESQTTDMDSGHNCTLPSAEARPGAIRRFPFT
jgi:hypothetical protein